VGGQRHFEFVWDRVKGAVNLRKHGVSFRNAATVFADVRAVTIFDTDHSNGEERWVTTGCAANGVCLVVVHTWVEIDEGNVRVRIISARKATKPESKAYEDSL
jgi:uncharacterized DUF497 family protein